MPTTACDVLVIGAGPAGSVAASLLARSGLSVRLVERKRFPRRKVCGACLSERTVAALSAAGLRQAVEGAVPLSAFRFAAGGRSADVPLRGGCVVSRSRLDAALVAEAIRGGVTFEDGTTADLGAVEGGARVVSLSDVEGDREGRCVRAKAVVVAAGLSGLALRGDLELRSRPARNARIGAGAEVADACDFYVPGTIFMATARPGYVGLVRTESGMLNVAAALDAGFVAASGGLGAAAAAVVREAGFPDEGLAALDWTGTPALTRRPPALAAERVFLVGDAAGYVEPFTGEGVGWAVGSAVAVLPFVEGAVAGWSPKLVRRWSAAHHRAVGRRQRLCRVLAPGLRSGALVSAAVRLLGSFPSAAGPVLRRLAAT